VSLLFRMNSTILPGFFVFASVYMEQEGRQTIQCKLLTDRIDPETQ